MKNIILFSLFVILLVSSSFAIVGSGGGTVRVVDVELTEEGNNYNIKPARLRFEFDEKPYAIQLRRVKPEYAWFLVMTLDANKLDDIFAHVTDYSFNLTLGEKLEIDINKDNINDFYVKLEDITSTGKSGSLRSAAFIIKRINVETLVANKEELDNNFSEANSSLNIMPFNEIVELPVTNESNKSVEINSITGAVVSDLGNGEPFYSRYLKRIFSFFWGLI